MRTPRRAVAALIVVVMAAVTLGAPAAAAPAEAPVTFTETQLADALFGAAARVKDTGAAFEKDVIESAELLDWRAKNPTADPATTAAHLHTVKSTVDSQLTAVDAAGQRSELIRRITQIVYATPGAEIVGRRMTDLLAVLTGRDLFTGGVRGLSTLGRVNGALQGLDLDAAFTRFAGDVLAAVHDQAGTDGTFAGAWRDGIGVAAAGQPFGLDPTASSAVLGALPVIRDEVDANALVAQGAQGPTALYTEIARQFGGLRGQFDATNTDLAGKVTAAAAEASKPGAAQTPADPTKVDQATKDQGDRQKKIDGYKGGADFLATMAGYFDPGDANRFTEYVTAVYKFATDTNNLITALTALAANTAGGFATLGYVGAALGAVSAIMQIFGGLFGSNHGTADAFTQVLTQMQSGFTNIQTSLKAISQTMNERFSRIDTSLSVIYTQMQARFTDVLNAIADVNANISDVYQQVMDLQSQVQAFGERLLSGIRDDNRDSFVHTVGQAVDFSRTNNNAPMPDYFQYYAPFVTNFQTTAKETSRNNNFVVKDLNQGDAKTALTSTGPAGAIDWLANHANQAYGTSFLVDTTDSTPNMDLWAQAARAYYLTANQNPQFAGQEGPAQVRASDIIDNGLTIRDHAAQFSKPPATGSPLNSPLFNGLYTDVNAKTTAFLDAAERMTHQPPVQYTGRAFNLWSDNAADIGANQYTGLPATPPTVGRCDINGAPSASTPSFVAAKGLSVSYVDGLYAEPGWNYAVCYQNLTATAPSWQSVKLPDGRYHNHGVLKMTADFNQSVNGELGRVDHVVKDYTYTTKAECESNTAAPQQPMCTDTVAQYLTDSQPWAAASDQSYPGDGGEGQWKALLSDRRARYYDLMAQQTSLDQIPEGHDLDNQVRLYRAYADLGLPRAEQTDDQLHALLYGDHGLVSNVDPSQTLSTIYTTAAAQERATHGAGPYPMPILDDGVPGTDPPLDCGTYRNGQRDPIGLCLGDIDGQRNARLRVAIRTHLRNIANKTETQTLPLVDEALANLQLVRQYTVTLYPTGYPVPAARRESR